MEIAVINLRTRQTMRIKQPISCFLCFFLALTACSGPTITTDPEPAKPAETKSADSNGILKPEEPKNEEPKSIKAPAQARTQPFLIPVIREAEDSQDPPPNQTDEPTNVNYADRSEKAQASQEAYENGPLSEANTEPASKVDIQAMFPGGSESFIRYVRNKFEYPTRCHEEGIDGYVLLRFIVDTRGNISQIKALEETPACPEFASEAIRVMKGSPKWIPAQVNGKFVSSYRTVPIKLTVQ